MESQPLAAVRVLVNDPDWLTQLSSKMLSPAQRVIVSLPKEAGRTMTSYSTKLSQPLLAGQV